jgi:opine dehydrogenase
LSEIAIAGAGAIARAYGAMLARDGHRVFMWSPRGGTRDIHDTVRATGLVEGSHAVTLSESPKRIAEADVVLVALPATAYGATLPVMAQQLRSHQTVFVSGALSLAPLWLAELAAANGAKPLVVASGTTVATARTIDGGVSVNTIRTRVSIASLPVARSDEALSAMAALFGDRFDAAADVLAVTLANINPVAHAAMALANLTRMEYGEAWPQYHYLTPAVARLVEAMDRERRAVAAAFGREVLPIEAHFQRSFDVPQATLADIAAELHRRRGGPAGPTSLDTRFVLEDVPYGLVFNAALGRIVNADTRATDATITLLGTLYGRDFGAGNPLIDALGLGAATRESLLARCRG